MNQESIDWIDFNNVLKIFITKLQKSMYHIEFKI